jgi:hypothetical protein
MPISYFGPVVLEDSTGALGGRLKESPIIVKLELSTPNPIYIDNSGAEPIDPNLLPLYMQISNGSIMFSSYEGNGIYLLDVVGMTDYLTQIDFQPNSQLFGDNALVDFLQNAQTNFTYDDEAPTCNMSSSIGAASYVKTGDIFDVTFTFNEDIYDGNYSPILLLSGASFEASLGTPGCTILSTTKPNNQTFVVQVQVNPGTEGSTVGVSLPSFIAYDEATNPCNFPGPGGLLKVEYTLDNTAPTPTQPGGELAATSVTTTSLTLSWSQAGDVSSFIDYHVYRSTTELFGVANIESSATLIETVLNNYSSNVTGLSPSTTYYFYIVVEDEAGNKAAYDTLTQATAAPADVTSPIPGNSGTLSATSITQTGLTLNWTIATDNTSSQANLQYLAYYSTSNNLSSVANVEANGTPVGSYTSNINTKNITGLTTATTYYFNVIVKDEANNKAIYSTLTQATSAPSAPTTIDGNNNTVDSNTTWGDGSSLDVTVDAVVESGILSLDVPSISAISGGGSILVHPGASISIVGPTGTRTMTVPSGKQYKLKP